MQNEDFCLNTDNLAPQSPGFHVLRDNKKKRSESQNIACDLQMTSQGLLPSLPKGLGHTYRAREAVACPSSDKRQETRLTRHVYDTGENKTTTIRIEDKRNET